MPIGLRVLVNYTQVRIPGPILKDLTNQPTRSANATSASASPGAATSPTGASARSSLLPGTGSALLTARNLNVALPRIAELRRCPDSPSAHHRKWVAQFNAITGGVGPEGAAGAGGSVCRARAGESVAKQARDGLCYRKEKFERQKDRPCEANSIAHYLPLDDLQVFQQGLMSILGRSSPIYVRVTQHVVLSPLQSRRGNRRTCVFPLSAAGTKRCQPLPAPSFSHFPPSRRTRQTLCNVCIFVPLTCEPTHAKNNPQ